MSDAKRIDTEFQAPAARLLNWRRRTLLDAAAPAPQREFTVVSTGRLALAPDYFAIEAQAGNDPYNSVGSRARPRQAARSAV